MDTISGKIYLHQSLKDVLSGYEFPSFTSLNNVLSSEKALYLAPWSFWKSQKINHSSVVPALYIDENTSSEESIPLHFLGRFSLIHSHQDPETELLSKIAQWHKYSEDNQNNAWLTSFFNQSFDAILISDDEGYVLHASEGIKEIAGYDPEEVVGVNSLDFTHPSDASRTHPQIHSLLLGERQSIKIEHRVRTKTGQFKWIEAIISDQRSNPYIRGIFTNLRDIDQRQRTLEMIELSNLRFKLASNATMDVIWDVDIHQDKIVFGENLTAAFGWKQRDLDTAQKWLSKIHPEDREAVDKSFFSAINSLNSTWSHDYRFLKKDGSYAHIQDRGSILRDENQKGFRMIGAMHDHSKSYHLNEVLIGREKRFRKLFEASLIGIASIELNTFKIQDFNQALLNILGYKEEDFAEKTIQQLIDEADQALFEDIIKDLKKHKSILPFQLSLIRKDLGRIKSVVSAVSLERSENTEDIAWLHFLDLSPIEQSANALMEAETRFKNYVEKSSDVLAILNDEGTYEYVSPNVESLLGFRPQEIIGLNNLELMHPEDVEIAAKAFGEAFKEIGKSTRSVFRAKHKTKGWTWVEANGRFVESDEGLKAYINVRDINKEHQIEEELRKLSLVANYTSNSVIITDAESRIEWVNDSFTKLSGYSLAEAQGKTVANLLHGKKSSTVDFALIKEKTLKKKVFTHENVNYNCKGKAYWIEASISGVLNENGDLKHIISIETDITERKRVERKLQRELSIIKKQNNKLQSFAHIIAHNFKAQTDSIRDLGHELATTSDTFIRKELIKLIDRNSLDLSNSLQELASLLHLDVKKTPKRDINLLSLVRKVKSSLEQMIIKYGADIKLDIPTELTINFHYSILQSIIYNLLYGSLSNRHRQRDHSIMFSTELIEDTCTLLIKDNGKGFYLTHPHNEDIIEIWSREKDKDEVAMGYYFCSQQVLRNHGNMSVIKNDSDGTTIQINLKRTKDA